MNDLPAAGPVRTPPQRMAAAWFLGIVLVGLFVFAWLRGAGRILLPVLLFLGIAVIVVRVIRSVMRPLP